MESFKLFLDAMSQVPYFPYSGGKLSIRNWVLEHMPKQGRIYVEPFAGRGNMFFLAKSKLDFQLWHINDLNTIPFFKGIQNIDLEQLPQATGRQVDRDTWLKHKIGAKSQDPMSLVLEPWISHKGHYDAGWAGAYSNTRKYDKQNYADKLTSVRDIMKDVEMSSGPWQSVPLSEYTQEDFIYLDPPYYETDNRHYQKGANEMDHPGLINTIKSLKAKWLLSHSYHPFYIRELGTPLATKQRQANQKALSGTSDVIVECLWKGNY